MRIGLIAPPWLPVPPPEYGGTEEVVDLLARGVSGAGHEVTLFTTGDSTCPVPRRWILDRAAGTTGGSQAEIRHVLHAYEELAGQVDVLHDHTLFGPQMSDRWPHTPVVTTNHGVFDAAAIDLYTRVAGRVAIVAISESQRAAAPQVPVARVIRHGVDTDRLRPQPNPGEGGYLAFLGRMSPTKGAHHAIAVARRVGLPLVIAAKMWEPEERRYFEERVEPELGDDIRFVGQVGRDDKARFLSDAVALLDPIGWPEPFGLVMAEALACGTPVIAFRQGAAPEIVEDGVTGFLCDDPDEMAERVAALASIERPACRAAAVSRFSATRMVSEHLALYADVIASADGWHRRAS